MAKRKNKPGAGRPKEGIDTLPKEWYKHVLTEYSQGASDVEIKAWIWTERGSFSDDLWDRWLIDEPEFSGTIRQGRKLSHAWWMKKGRKSLENKDFSYTGWYMNMKNRFGWADKKPEAEEQLKYDPPTININLPDFGLVKNEPVAGKDSNEQG